jgi:hypothetical protein
LDASDGNGYRIRVVSINPEIIGTDNGKDITIFGLKIGAGISSEIESPIVYPVPFDDELIITLPDSDLKNGIVQNISIVDLLGRKRINIDASELIFTNNSARISTDELNSGTYFLFIETTQKSYQKLIIKLKFK